MKISLFHGFPTIHYEMLGYIIDYFISMNLEIDYYLFLNDSYIDWSSYYNKNFKTKINFKNILTFDPDNYDFIIIITDDDPLFPITDNQVFKILTPEMKIKVKEWEKKYDYTKIISIDHHSTQRRKDVLARLGTRFFNSRPDCNWVLPCYQAINKFDKKILLQNNQKIIVSCVGTNNIPPSDDFLKSLFENFDQIEFNFINRKINKKFPSQNIRIWENCSTEIMMNIIKQSHYVLCLDNLENKQPISNLMSGVVPISFNYGCQLIIPETWQKFYNFKSIIKYQDNILQNSPIITKLTLSKETNLDNIYNELYLLVAHRNISFDRIFKLKFPDFRSNLSLNSSYSKIYKYLKIQPSNVYIELGFNELDDVKNDFRDINHFIIDDKDYNDCMKFKSDNKIKLHKNTLENLENIITHFKESVIFNVNISNENFEDQMKIISRRVFNDLIIIKNQTTDLIEKLPSYFKRYYNTYTINDNKKNIKFLVILPIL